MSEESNLSEKGMRPNKLGIKLSYRMQRRLIIPANIGAGVQKGSRLNTTPVDVYYHSYFRCNADV